MPPSPSDEPQRKPPFITVIIPSYNYRDYVARAIDSVLEQTYPHREVIVVDDGSVDDSWGVICGYGDRIGAIRLENRGPLKACMAATASSRGDYIYILDSDDVLATPTALETIAQAIGPDTAKVQFPLRPINAAGEPIGRPSPKLPVGLSRRDLIEQVAASGCYVTPPTSGNVYRRDVWMLAQPVDYEIWTDGIAYLAAPFFGEVVTIAKPLACHRRHDSNASAAGSVINLLRAEREVFTARIHHLQTLAGVASPRGFTPPEACFGYIERQILEDIWSGKPIGRATLAAGFRAVLREPNPPMRRAFFLAWLAALGFAPRRFAPTLARLKLPPSQRPRFAAFLRAFY